MTVLNIKILHNTDFCYDAMKFFFKFTVIFWGKIIVKYCVQPSANERELSNKYKSLLPTNKFRKVSETLSVEQR